MSQRGQFGNPGGFGGRLRSSAVLDVGDAATLLREWVFTDTAAADDANAVAWLEAAKRAGRRVFWLFDGTAGTAATGTERILWATNFVNHPIEGLIDGRIESIGEIERGLPSSDDPAERVSVSMVLRRDAALGSLLVGTTTASTATEYRGKSIYNLSGKVCLAFVDGTEIVSIPVTPTLYLSDDPDVSDTQVGLEFASRDDGVFGPSRFGVVLADLTAATYKSGTTYTDGVEVDFTSADWAALRRRLTANAEASIPYVLGRTPIPLTRGTDAADGDTWFCACVGLGYPDLSLIYDGPDHASDPVAGGMKYHDGRPFFFIRDYKHPVTKEAELTRDGRFLPGVVPTLVNLEVTLPNGETRRLWVTFFHTNTNHEADSWVFYPPPGYAASMLDTERATPADFLIHLFKFHAWTEAARLAVEESDFRALDPGGVLSDAFGGLLTSGATLGEIAGHIAQPGQWDLWIDTDDKLHAAARLQWNSADVVELLAGTLPRIGAVEVLAGTFHELPPLAEGSRGAPATLLAPRWATAIRDFWEGHLRLPERVQGSSPLPIGRTVEAEVSAEWVLPGAATRVFQMAAEQRSQVWRRFQIGLDPWIAGARLGSYYLFSYPYALGVGGAMGVTDRLVRLERIVLDPTNHTATATFCDYGKLQDILPWVLDGVDAWWRVRPDALTGSFGTVATSANILADVAIFATAEVGDEVWLTGPDIPDADAGHFKIAALVSDFEVTIDTTLTVSEAAYDTKSNLRIVKTHASPDTGSTFRPSRGRLCDDAAGTFTNGDPGYQLV